MTFPFGATTAKIGRTLTTKNTKYLSPDRMVDCSTCLFPDTTWVIHNCEHSIFPDSIHELMLKFFRADGNMTVFDDQDATQYMECSDAYDEKNAFLSPMTVSDVPDQPAQRQGILSLLRDFFASLIALIRQLFTKEQ